MKTVFLATALVFGILAADASASSVKDQLSALLKEKSQKGQLLKYLQADVTKAQKFCPEIMDPGFPELTQELGVGIFVRNELTNYCQSQTVFEKAKTKAPAKQMKPAIQQEVEIEVEGFVNNYDAYAKYFNPQEKPKQEDITEIKTKYFNFEIDRSTGLQEQAREFVRNGGLKRLLEQNPALIGSIAQMQAYFGGGRWNRYNRNQAQGFNPDPVLRKEYYNPYGSKEVFDVTIFSFFHTMLEQADKDLPRDEATYQKLLAEIKKGIRVRKLMQQ